MIRRLLRALGNARALTLLLMCGSSTLIASKWEFELDETT
jgi:hypothetical protein